MKALDFDGSGYQRPGMQVELVQMNRGGDGGLNFSLYEKYCY